MCSGLSDRKHNQTPRTVQTFFAPIPPPSNPTRNPLPNPHRNPLIYIICLLIHIRRIRALIGFMLLIPLIPLIPFFCAFLRRFGLRKIIHLINIV